jgi:MoaA/NifB/PqqE/SkfB family radical SAM enzyme
VKHNVLDFLGDALRSPLFKKVEYIINSGQGEPTLTDLKQVLLTEHEVLPKATLQVSTNGILHDKVVDAVLPVLRQGAQIDVGISLDGVGEAHDRVRGVPGNFECVNTLILDLLRVKKTYPCLNVTVGSTLTDHTVEHTQDLVDYAHKMGVTFMWHWFNQSSFYGNVQAPQPKDAEALSEAVRAVVPKGLYRDFWLQSFSGETPSFQCFALQSFCVIKCDGEIVPCLSKWNRSIGNVKDADPLTLWHSGLAKERRREVSTCAGCLNSWGCGWSLQTEYFRVLKYAMKKRLGVNGRGYA